MTNLVNAEKITGIPELHEEFDNEGVKRYEETILFISETDPRKENSIRNEFNQYFIRIGKNAKYDKNGKIVWLLMRDDKGKVITDQSFGSGEKFNN